MNQLYPPQTQRVDRTAYPSGDILNYENGRPQYHLLPSNHPDVLAEKQRREVKNIFKTKLKVA